MQAQLQQLEKDYGIVWQKYRIGDLFEKLKTKTLKFKTSELPSKPQNEFTLPALTAGVKNQGLNNFVPRSGATILKDVISISANGANTGATFYQKKEFTVLQDAYAIDWKLTNHELTDVHYIYFVAAISKVIHGNYAWTNKAGWERIKMDEIQLPTKIVRGASEVAFDFMEVFIATLKAERIATLKAYLKTTGLSDYTLTDLEQSTLDSIDKVQWDVFKIEDVLDWQQNIAELNPLHLNSLSVDDEKKYPFYGQATANNGIIEYRHLNDDVLNNKQGKPTILIHSNNQNTVYLETPFYLKDGHGATSVLQSSHLNKMTAQFLMGSIKKVILQKYTYNSKATKIKLKNTKITLPIKPDKTPDYAFMESFISAMQKVVIKNVVDYAGQKIDAHQQVTKVG